MSCIIRFFIFQLNGGEIIPEQRINDEIKAREVRVVNSTGEQLGVMPLVEALKLAEEQDQDLVEVSPEAKPPVCKIFNYGKYKFEQSKKEKEARKRQHTILIKEIKFRPKIDSHDYETKKGHVLRFIEDGNKVKVTIMYRGREMDHVELGRKILDRLVKDLDDKVTVESMPRVDGRNMVMMVGPKRSEPAAGKGEKKT
ncbi:translation initiation factor IF-3 [candidate division FCPU426 bacterium]|nr:translation initiation factor IF-3 [candidate division FCPU426 bacterium]